MTRHELIRALRDAAGSSESLFEKHESDLMYEAADMLENGIEAPWIHCTWREPNEDEAQAQKEEYGETFPIATFPTPKDGEEILITQQMWNRTESRTERYVSYDIAQSDCGMLSLENAYDFENVIAWMPMPKPYEESDT